MDDITADACTLLDVLDQQCREQPDTVAFRFLSDGETESASLSYRALQTQAKQIAAHLSSRSLKTRTALLIFPSGLDFICAFYGCLYAGIIAVPVSLPRNVRQLPRTENIARDAGVELVLTNDATQSALETVVSSSMLSTLPWQTLETILQAPVMPAEEVSMEPESLAFLQYTSGSTGHPKGVMVSHRNLLKNHGMMQASLKQSEATITVCWLPLFHDMGLIGNVLQTVYIGGQCILMPPETILMKPLRWLQAISHYRADHSGGPNFAYELCQRRISKEARATLSLDCWDIAFVGAEPIRAHTLERFQECFVECGFQEDAFFPCYGLAEACLFVSGNGRLKGAYAVDFDSEALKHKQARATTEGKQSRRLVGCGKSWMSAQVKIVDPATKQSCPDGMIGEIWASGPHIAAGYWNQPEASQQAFAATLADALDSALPALRTGDLGFIYNDELFISSRLKDLLIIAGRNHHPADIEESVENCHSAIRIGCVAAFAVDVDDAEKVVLLAELERTARNEDPAPIKQAIRAAVALQHDLMLHDISLIPPASCPRTTSGKVMRHRCKQLWIEQQTSRLLNT